MTKVNYFLKIDGIEGESQDNTHKGEIEIETWSWSENQTDRSSNGGGGGAGKIQMQDFQFTMRMNKASPKLLLACASGEHLKKATLTGRIAGKEAQEFLQIGFTDIVVSFFQTGVSSGGSLLPEDHVSLHFSTIQYQYRARKADGSLDNLIQVGWDLKQNRPAVQKALV